MKLGAQVTSSGSPRNRALLQNEAYPQSGFRAVTSSSDVVMLEQSASHIVPVLLLASSHWAGWHFTREAGEELANYEFLGHVHYSYTHEYR